MSDHDGSLIVTGFSQFEVGSNKQRHGKSRSKACLHCRRRKMKCDGVKPACFQCMRAERGGECEYDDGVTKTGTQVLYERLAQLEKRFRDLQASRGESTRLRRSPHSARGGSRPSLARSSSMPGMHRDGAGGAPMHPNGRLGPGSIHRGYTGGSPEISYANFELSRSSSRSSSRSPSEWSYDGHAATPMMPAQYTPVPQVYYADQYSSSHESLPYNVFAESAPDISRPLDFPDPGPHDVDKQALSAASRFARDLPLETLEHLVNALLPHAHQIGVTLLPSYINELALLNPPSEAIGYAMILWGAHFSKDPAMHELKPMLLQRALDALPQLLFNPAGNSNGASAAMLGSCNANMGNAIAASVVLALYFFTHGRHLEGAYHTTNASQLSLACGLHQLPDPRVLPDIESEISDLALPDTLNFAFSGSAECGTGVAAGLLPPLRTRLDALTRQHKFWNLFVLQRTWAAAGGMKTPSAHWGATPGAPGHERNPKTTITTPWPEDWGLLMIDNPAGVGNATQPPLEASQAPVDDFLAGRDVTPSKSCFHNRAKSAALYDAAADLGAYIDPYSPSDEDGKRFSALQFALGAFTKYLTPISSNDFRAPSFQKSSLYSTHTVAHAAIIRLNYRIADVAYSESISNSDGLASPSGQALASAEKCMQSVQEILHIIASMGSADYEFLEPVIGSCWVSAAEVLARELERLGHLDSPDTVRLSSEIDILVTALKQLGTIFPIGLTQAKDIIVLKSNAIQHKSQPV